MRFPISLNLSMAAYLVRKNRGGERRFPLVLMLEPTHACNLACRACGRIEEYRDTLDRRLSAEECLDAAAACDAPVVSVSGGEPLLHPEIDRIVRGLIAMGRHVYLCTNGLKLAEFVERSRPSPRLFVNVHLDGMARYHDALTRRPGVFGAATEAIWLAKQKGFQVTTNTTVYKDTCTEELRSLFGYLSALGVDGFFIAPGYHYAGVEGEDFLDKEEVFAKFEDVRPLAQSFRFHSSPLYLDFLRGKKSYDCAPWGTVTRNPMGWKAPCYLITDTHYGDFESLMRSVDWEHYGPGRDPRCKECMMHCGFEPAAVLALREHPRDLLTMLRWNLS